MENERIFSLAERKMLKYHPSVYAKPSELNTIYSPHMTITSKVNVHMIQSSFLSLQIVPFPSHILPLSPLRGHCSPFLKVRTMRNVPLSLSIPYRIGAMAKKSIWCSDVMDAAAQLLERGGRWRGKDSAQPRPSSSEAPGKSGAKM